MELVGDRTVTRMTFPARAELDQVHRLARVHVEDVANPVAKAERVWSQVRADAAANPLVLGRGALEPRAVVVCHTGVRELPGDAGAEIGTQRLPLDRQQPVALEVAERAVVGDDLEAVADGLEAAPGPVPAVGALTDQVGQQLRAL